MKTEIVIKSRISEIPKTAEFVAAFGKKYNFADESILDLCVALDEIVNNIVKYSYSGEPDNEIKISLSFKDDSLNVVVSDDGIPFNPCKIEKPDLSTPIEDKPIGGLGFYLVKQLMDSVEYKREDNKNVLFLNKKIKKYENEKHET